MQATKIARSMVTEYGFSDKLGRLRYSSNQEEVFLGHSVAQEKNVSDATAQLIDEEVRRFVEEGEVEARRILTEYHDELEAIAQGLLEYETLDRDEVDALIKGQKIRQGGDDEDTSNGASSTHTSVPTTDNVSGADRTPPGGAEPDPAE